MPCRPAQQHQEDSIDEDGPDSNDSSSQEDEDDSNHDQIMSALRPLPPDAEISKLRSVLALCQRTLTDMRAKLGHVTKERNALSAALPSKKSKAVLNKSDSLDESIGRVAKKFALLYHLWVIQGLFPIANNPSVDLYSNHRWTSLAAKRDGALTELFMITPNTLHKQMGTYKAFGSVVIKEASALIFAPLNVSDPTIFTSPTRKRGDQEMKQLSFKDGGYHRMAPVLFKDLAGEAHAGYLRSPVLVNIIHLLMFGRAALAQEKARGGPKARGKIHNVHSVTEGLVAAAAIFARYLLTPDTELQAIGSETKIPYEEDYDFYLECLFKRSKWAIETMEFFNAEIFGGKQVTKPSTEAPAQPATPCTWEDNFIDNLDNAEPEAAEPAAEQISTPSSPVHSSPEPLGHPSPPHFCHSSPHSPIPLSAPRSYNRDPSPPPSLPLSDPPQVVSMVSIQNHSATATSSVSRLQVEVGQMSISGTGTNGGSTEQVATAQVPASKGRKASSMLARRITQVPATLPETFPPADSDPLVKKHMTCSHANKTKK